jgi:hypothetical protein
VSIGNEISRPYEGLGKRPISVAWMKWRASAVRIMKNRKWSMPMIQSFDWKEAKDIWFADGATPEEMVSEEEFYMKQDWEPK